MHVSVALLKVTDQFVPFTSPLSEKVTGYAIVRLAGFPAFATV